MTPRVMENLSTATAHRDWDQRWGSEEGRSDWLVPESDVVSTASGLRARGAIRAVDLGCGVGRHALYLASLGFAVAALDGSETGIAFARTAAAKAGHSIDFQTGLMTALPYADQNFDYVLAWNLIYHGDREVVQRCLTEVRRVLRRGGTFQGTFLSKRNRHYGHGRELAPNTFILEGVSDKGHPHFYCHAAELVKLLEGFEIVSLIDREQLQPGSYHWHFVAERLEGNACA